MNVYIEELKCKICGKHTDAITVNWKPSCSEHGDTVEKVYTPVKEDPK